MAAETVMSLVSAHHRVFPTRFVSISYKTGTDGAGQMRLGPPPPPSGASSLALQVLEIGPLCFQQEKPIEAHVLAQIPGAL